MTLDRFVLTTVPLCLLLSACAGAPAPRASGGSAAAGSRAEAAGAEPAGRASPPSTRRGDGGAPAPVLLPQPADPTVSFIVWFRVGSQDDPPGKEGLALLTAAMVAEASTQERSYQEILEALYPLASSYQARVDREMTTFSGRTHRDNLEAFVELYTQAFLAPRFSREDFERLKSRQLNELTTSLRYADDEELGKAALMSSVFAGTGYRHPPLGTVAGLEAITLDDVQAFYRRAYSRENAVLAVGGGYPPGLVERLEAALAELPAGAPRTTPPPRPPAIEGRSVLLVAKPGADASISIGFPLDVHRGEPDFYALWLANSWLGEHRNSASHLYQVIREARGLNYGDYSYVEAFPEGGRRQFPPTNVSRRQQLFEVWIRTLPNDQALFALRSALREVDRLATEGLSEEEFQLTRSFLSKYARHYAPDTLGRLGFAVDDRFYRIAAPGHLERLKEALSGLSREEVNAAVRRHLQTEDLEIAIVTGEAEALKQALLSGEPTPIRYANEKPPEVLAEDEEIARYPLRIEAAAVTIVPVDEIFER